MTVAQDNGNMIPFFMENDWVGKLGLKFKKNYIYYVFNFQISELLKFVNFQNSKIGQNWLIWRKSKTNLTPSV